MTPDYKYCYVLYDKKAEQVNIILSTQSMDGTGRSFDHLRVIGKMFKTYWIWSYDRD